MFFAPSRTASDTSRSEIYWQYGIFHTYTSEVPYKVLPDLKQGQYYVTAPKPNLVTNIEPLFYNHRHYYVQKLTNIILHSKVLDCSMDQIILFIVNRHLSHILSSSFSFDEVREYWTSASLQFNIMAPTQIFSLMTNMWLLSFKNKCPTPSTSPYKSLTHIG